MEKNFEYFGLFIDDNTFKQETINFFNNILLKDKRQIKNFYFDHCTLLHKSQLKDNEELYYYLENNLGKQVMIQLVAIGENDKVLAYKVALPNNFCVNCANKIPHITVLTFKNEKPVDSNGITEWKGIYPVNVMTTLRKVSYSNK